MTFACGPSSVGDVLDARRFDARKSAENHVRAILDDAEFLDVFRSVVFTYTGTHVRHQQCQQIARVTGKNVDTVNRWLDGVTSPKAADVWPIFFVVIMQSMSASAQEELRSSILGAS